MTKYGRLDRRQRPPTGQCRKPISNAARMNGCRCRVQTPRRHNYSVAGYKDGSVDLCVMNVWRLHAGRRGSPRHGLRPPVLVEFPNIVKGQEIGVNQPNGTASEKPPEDPPLTPRLPPSFTTRGIWHRRYRPTRRPGCNRLQRLGKNISTRLSHSLFHPCSLSLSLSLSLSHSLSHSLFEIRAAAGGKQMINPLLCIRGRPFRLIFIRAARTRRLFRRKPAR